MSAFLYQASHPDAMLQPPPQAPARQRPEPQLPSQPGEHCGEEAEGVLRPFSLLLGKVKQEATKIRCPQVDMW